MTERADLNQDELQLLDITRAGAKALWSMSASQRNREAMRKYGMIPLIARVLKTIHLDVAVPAVGLLQMCTSETSFQLAIQTEKMVTDLITHLANDDKDLKVCNQCECTKIDTNMQGQPLLTMHWLIMIVAIGKCCCKHAM